jgi:hypothetical protein
MHLDLIQTSSAAINSIYILRNFFDDKNYCDFLQKKIEDFTQEDEMNHKTNVKGYMTNWCKLLEDSDFNNFHIKILEILGVIWTLRTPHISQRNNFYIFESWGMKHVKGNHTANHIHQCPFAATYNFKVPSDVFMKFDDYETTIKLESNMLLLFPGLTKHAVSSEQSEDYRISMACNIGMKSLDDHND